jgi:hypothetical protein
MQHIWHWGSSSLQGQSAGHGMSQETGLGDQFFSRNEKVMCSRITAAVTVHFLLSFVHHVHR